MECKQYEKLNFNEIYEDNNYPQKMYYILNEYFSRIKYEYNLNEDEINDKLNNLLNNIKDFKFIDTMPEGFENSMGLCDYEDETIYITNEYFKNENYFNFLQSIFHEIHHATSLDEYRNISGMYEKIIKENGDIYFSKKYTCLDEVTTDMTSVRIISNVKDCQTPTVLAGYRDVMFVGGMLEATLGVSEKEFLKTSIKNREHFDEHMSNKFYSKEDYILMMSAFSHISNSIYSNTYFAKQNGISEVEAKINKTESLKDLTYTMLVGMDSRIKKDITDTEDIVMTEYIQKQKFLINKVYLNMKEGIKRLDIEENFQDYEEYFNNEVYHRKTFNRILLLEMINDNKDKLTDDEYNSNLDLIISSENCTNLLSELQDKYKFEINEESKDFTKAMDAQYLQKIYNEEFTDETWDNTELIKKVKENFCISQKTFEDELKSYVKDDTEILNNNIIENAQTNTVEHEL